MPAQKGRSLVLKFDSASGTTVAAATENGMTINGEAVESTNKDSNGWRELLAAAGNAHVTLSISGRATDSAHLTTLASRALAQSIDAYGIVFGNLDKLEGSYQVTQWQVQGAHNDAQTFSCTLESSGAQTLTVAA